MNFFRFLCGQHTCCDFHTEIDEILESLPRDEGARRRMLERIERSANDATGELDHNQGTWSDQETGSSEDEALDERAKHQGLQPLLTQVKPCTAQRWSQGTFLILFLQSW